MGKKNVAFFTMEVAIENFFDLSSGGLGGVSGSFLTAAKDNEKIDVTGVTICWRERYYEQKLGPNGMEIHYTARWYEDILENTRKKVKIQLGDNPNVLVKVYRLDPEIFNTAPILYLDCDFEGNDGLTRENTKRLYQGNENQRIAQEIILGIGGMRTLRALDIPVDIVHLNEGAAVLAAIGLLRQKILQGLNFEQALNFVREHTVFTTHTPEVAGNMSHNLDLMIKLGAFPGLTREQVVYLAGDSSIFNNTAVTLGKLAEKKANTVSEQHQKTAEKMWDWVSGCCPIVAVTNGMDQRWQRKEFRQAKTVKDIEKAKIKGNKLLLNYISEAIGKNLNKKTFTIGWARRFTKYKRPDLIFYDRQWFERMLRENVIQVIFSGKPYPADREMINLWNSILRLSKELPNLVILPNYGINLRRTLQSGAHLWLNTPQPPREACGDWGMNACMNGCVYASTRDGWVLEWKDKTGLLLFGPENICSSQQEQDRQDAEGLKKTIEKAVDIFYNDPGLWWEMSLASKNNAETHFNSQRMLQDYIDKLYCF